MRTAVIHTWFRKADTLTIEHAEFASSLRGCGWRLGTLHRRVRFAFTVLPVHPHGTVSSWQQGPSTMSSMFSATALAAGCLLVFTGATCLVTAGAAGTNGGSGATYCNVNDSNPSRYPLVVLGAILPIHRPDGSTSKSNIQRAEAIAFAVNKVNNANPAILPGIRLAFCIKDSSLLINTALDEALEFVTGSVSSDNGQLYRVSGIIGETQSSISIFMASLLRLHRIPQVSPFSTTPQLSDKSRFSYFLRIPPSDTYQAEALVDLVEYFNWTYIIAINSDDDYGLNGIRKFTSILQTRARNATKRCIAASISIPFPSPERSAFDDAAQMIIGSPLVKNVSAVVLFGHREIAEGMLDALASRNYTRRLLWLGSDSWGDALSGKYPGMIKNLVSISSATSRAAEFENYFKSLHVSNYTSNPWFADYWQTVFNCSLNSANASRSACDAANQHLSSLTYDSYIPLTIDAVNAFAYSIRNLQIQLCAGKDLCKEMLSALDSRRYIPGELLLPFLFNVSFLSQSGRTFTFDKNGDPSEASYTIQNLLLYNSNYSYESVGYWNNANSAGPLTFTKKVTWNDDQGSNASRCSEPCHTGERRSYLSDCCWSCVTCEGMSQISDGITCTSCNYSFMPNNFRDACMPISVSYYSIGDPWAIAVVVIACLGILATISVIVIVIRYFTHKVIKAAGRELTGFLLVGILLCYFVPFLFIIKPSAAICAVRRFGVGFSFSICFSALLVRIIRIHRIFNRSASTKTPPCVGSVSQAIFTLILIGGQVLIVAVWLVAERPVVKYNYSSTTGEVLCKESPYAGLSVTLGYNFVLLLTATYFAVRTRRVPKNFNESKFIGLTVYSLVIIWAVFLPTYYGTAGLGGLYQIATQLVAIVLSASVVLGAILVPRLVYLFRCVYLGDQNLESDLHGKSLGITATFSAKPTVTPINHQQQQINSSATTESIGALPMNVITQN